MCRLNSTVNYMFPMCIRCPHSSFPSSLPNMRLLPIFLPYYFSIRFSLEQHEKYQPSYVSRYFNVFATLIKGCLIVTSLNIQLSASLWRLLGRPERWQVTNKLEVRLAFIQFRLFGDSDICVRVNVVPSGVIRIGNLNAVTWHTSFTVHSPWIAIVWPQRGWRCLLWPLNTWANFRSLLNFFFISIHQYLSGMVLHSWDSRYQIHIFRHRVETFHSQMKVVDGSAGELWGLPQRKKIYTTRPCIHWLFFGVHTRNLSGN
jgi:hypothetical protein